MLSTLLLAAALAASDSTVYPVLNHGRVAGAMTVVKKGDTVTIRYVFTDRNRGTRAEVRFGIRGDSLRWAESRTVLANDELGPLQLRLDVAGDSLRRTIGTRSTGEKLLPGRSSPRRTRRSSRRASPRIFSGSRTNHPRFRAD